MLVLLLLLTACIPEAEAVHWYIWARDVWFRSPPLSLIKNGTTFHYPSQVLWLSQVQTDAQVRSVIVAEMWDAQGFEQIMHAWFLGFGTLALSVPWLFVLITSQWLQQMLSGVGPVTRRCHCAWCLLRAGLGVNLRVSLLFVTPCKCSTTHVTLKRFLPCMCPYVGGEVVWPTELSEADPTLEGLLACVYPYVSRQFVASRESAVTLVHWASVRPLVHRSFTGTVWVLSCPDWDEPNGHCGLLEHLVEDLVTLWGWLVQLCDWSRGGGCW